MRRPRWYEVVTPDYVTYSGYIGGYDPPEYGADYVPVFTTSARRAKVLAVRVMRRQGMGYVRDAENPYAGLKATPVSEETMAEYRDDHCHARADIIRLLGR